MHAYRKFAVAGITAAAIVGAGTAALATSGSDTTSGSGSTRANSAGPRHHAASGNARRHRWLRRHLVHGDLITSTKKNGFVTHSAARGKADSVSPTSITVKAADGYTETFAITKDTRVRERTPGHRRGKPGSISDVHTGDNVAVLGRKPEKSTDDPQATVIVDGLRK